MAHKNSCIYSTYVKQELPFHSLMALCFIIGSSGPWLLSPVYLLMQRAVQADVVNNGNKLG